MNSLVVRLAKHFRVSALTSSSHAAGAHGSWRLCYSTTPYESESGEQLHNNAEVKNDELDEGIDDFLGGKHELQLQGVDPKKGWGFRGVHKAVLCGKVGQAPIQKMPRDGKNVTIFTVGTGGKGQGLFDQRLVGEKDLPKPVQWHRIAVHNQTLGTYAVQQLVKNSSVYVEGDIEVRIYNDRINGDMKSIPEIGVRRDGKIRLIKNGESASKISLDDLREGLY